MSLNKFMHQRNRYKNKKPSFLDLALKYPEFRAHTTQDESGKVFLDFKNAEALRALTTCLLKEDFGLSMELPSDRLVPTLPLRLNYIHWLEDIVGKEENKWGIDIGTGASCIYPVLAASMNKWHFLATEADDENFVYANKNVSANNLQDYINVLQVTSEDILVAPLQSFTQTNKFDFCMCNPPFFADHLEAQAITNTRSAQRPEAGSVSTASPQECIAQGGEVGFIRHMIEESTVLRDKIRVYTSMVGKKSSLQHLKEDLKHHKVAKYSTTEFCQGKTMRWGIAWTYDPTVHFPKSSFEARKEKPPLQYIIPRGAGGVDYKVHEIAAYLQSLLESIKFHCYQGKKAKSYTSITLTAVENTWCHQRRFRRQQKQQLMSLQTYAVKPINSEPSPQKAEVITAESSPKKAEVITAESSPKKAEVITAESSPKKAEVITAESSPQKAEIMSESIPLIVENRSAESNHSQVTQKRVLETADEHITSEPKRSRSDSVSDNATSACVNGSAKINTTNFSPSKKNDSNEPESQELNKSLTDSSPTEYILKCVLRLKLVDEQVQLELEWLGGESRELMHQVLTFIKNKLTVPVGKC
ncbi:RNA N6-adenosine-methyltransferase mettl16-like [Biomphalaria glabrata]|uniref:U6 small nuclear RNA (adenine-(43)-N(6))-methyltransferase n=1 Tax=Biomphalaria glabrata TaxID=6526 RepID=A0A9W2YHJ1_BIOGL|nr:RNA N6-adenosine-methyltransferase mettl16-like [Biomphalaria glabrata]XP_055862191.1 RNA N6-adenosine-methyltransferase mettl16-like [Biomphalaria glabrata]XP_055862192.1 RNA N6-adenosine-methyltransferase mettl16-like [Biomphalaria glabrata]XP_055862193.1 RNA N6-adenosine-methyltransferase mettl16-like [Biomphalaria glabrata]